MKYIRRAAQDVWMCLILVAAAGLFSGCGDSYADKPLLTIDSDEMQSIQANLEAEKEAAATNAEDATAAESPGTSDTVNRDTPASGEPVKQAAAKPDKSLPAKSSGDIPPVTPPGGDPQALLPSEPREVKLLVPQNSFQKVGPDDALRISYDDVDLLKVLNMEPVTIDAPKLLPKWLKDLDGKRIRLRGFMFPPFSPTDISAFVLARDNAICCFGRNPKPYDVIQVVMRKDVTANYIQNRPFDVVGTFHIDLVSYDDKKVDGLYLIDDAIIIDK